MKHLATALVLPLVLLGGSATASVGTSTEDRALRDVTAVVREVRAATVDGTEWVEAVLAIEGEPDTPVRIGPPQSLAEADFALRRGDVVRVRLFTDRQPAEVQRIRNATTGRVLRVQCLHGEPLWHRAGGGAARGPRHRGGR